jgi:hypothetical protein
MIYFLQAGDDGPIKIGYSKNPEDRRDSLQTGNHLDLKLIGVIPGKTTLEEKLHNRFDKYRIKGEWFECSSDIIEFIISNSRYGAVRFLSNETPFVNLMPPEQCDVMKKLCLVEVYYPRLFAEAEMEFRKLKSDLFDFWLLHPIGLPGGYYIRVVPNYTGEIPDVDTMIDFCDSKGHNGLILQGIPWLDQFRILKVQVMHTQSPYITNLKRDFPYLHYEEDPFITAYNTLFNRENQEHYVITDTDY